MTATTLEQFYFVLDLPDLKVAADGKRVVFFQFYDPSNMVMNGEPVALDLISEFAETYYPDSDGYITLRNLGDMARSYLSPRKLSAVNMANATQVWSRPYVLLAIRVCNPELYTQVYGTYSTCVYYSNIRIGVQPSSYGMFLSRYHARKVLPWQPMLFSHIIFSNWSSKLVVAYKDSEGAPHRATHTFSVNGAELHDVLHYNLTLASIATLLSIAADSIVSVDIFLLDNGTVQDYISFEIDRDHHRKPQGFCFTNCFGVPETEVLVGKDVRSDKMESEHSFVSNVYKKVYTELTEEHKVCSGFIQSDTYHSLLDMVRSEEVKLLENATMGEEVAVTEIDFSEQRPHTAPNSVYVTYRVAERHQQKFVRDPQLPTRIFDESFDDSFE